MTESLSYKFKYVIKNNTCVNDEQKANRLIWDYIDSFKSEYKKKNVMLEARENRMRLNKEINKAQLCAI